MHSTSIPLFLIVASLVSTSLGLHHLVVEARRSLEIFLPRQTTPGPCTSICAPIESTVATCSIASCLCTTAVVTSLQVCINCAVSAEPSASVIASAQSLIDTFDTTCGTTAGLPPLTIATGTAVSTSTTSPVPVSTLPGGSVTPSTSATVVVPVTSISQATVGPSSTSSATNTASSAGVSGLSLKNSALPSKVVLHWTGVLLGLAAGILLVF